MEKDKKLKTYQSEEGSFPLNVDNIFKIIRALYKYVDREAQKRKEEGHDAYFTQIIDYDNRKSKLYTSVTDTSGNFSEFNLASLVLSDNGQNLTLEVKEHPSVFGVNPSG